DYFCEDGSSRDVYAGTTFGLLTAFDLVGPDDAVLRNRIRDDVISMTSYLVSHGWSVVRPHTTVSTSGSENFVFPLFVINPEPRQLAIEHLTDWITYRNTSDQAVTNSTRCGVDLTCVGAGDVDLHVETPQGPQTVTVPQTGSGMRAADPLPIVQRPRGEDFLWQRSPYTLDGSGHPNEEQPGIDFLLPYWMLRYAADVSAPDYAPFPPSIGPTAGGPTGS